jgi:NADH dehydrogenase/NADH:ubiquinone oxidoreductase subunit G
MEEEIKNDLNKELEKAKYSFEPKVVDVMLAQIKKFLEANFESVPEEINLHIKLNGGSALIPIMKMNKQKEEAISEEKKEESK